MNFEGDPSKNWFKWRRTFERYRATQDWNTSPSDVLAMKFIVAFGEKALGICLQLNLDEKEMSDYETLMCRFEEHFVPRRNLTQHRHALLTQKQDKNETVEEYSGLLKRLSEKCAFGDLTEDVLKMVFIAGLRDDICKKKLLEGERSWEDVVNFAILAEHINKTCSEMCDKANVGKTKGDKDKSKANKDKEKGNKDKAKADDKGNNSKKSDKANDNKGDKGEKKFCTFCGSKHEKAKCPAYKKECPICKKPNHFAKMCRNKKTDGFVMV